MKKTINDDYSERHIPEWFQSVSDPKDIAKKKKRKTDV